MAFKGTTRRTARQIAEEIEAVGGDLNAATSVETTAYYARMLKAGRAARRSTCCPTSCPIRRFEPDELAREKNVIVQEIGACRGHARRSRVRAAAGDRVSGSAGRPLDPRHAARRCARSTPSKLRTYLARNYRAPDMVVGAAGAVDHAQIVEEVERRFATFAGPTAPAPEPARFGGGNDVEARDLEQVHVTLAMEGVPQRDPALYSLQVFTNVLGGGMSSRLFQEVREMRGLCYSIYAFHWPYTDTGMFGLYAGTDAADAAELMQVVIDEIGQAAETITEAEVNRAKAQMKAGLLMALESSGARAEQLARQMLILRPPDSDRARSSPRSKA